VVRANGGVAVIGGPPKSEAADAGACCSGRKLSRVLDASKRATDATAPSPATAAELARRIYGRSHLTGEFTLRSGAVSHEYFDKYRFESDPGLLRDVAEAVSARLPDRVDALAGLELGGVPIATACSLVCGLPSLFVRKLAKTYGTCQLAEGGPVRGRRLAVIEDVVTSGGQVIDSCRELREQGADIAVVLCVIDREAGGAEALAREGLELRSVFTASELDRAVSDDPLVAAERSLVELVEGVRALAYERPSERTVEAMLRERRGTCSTKHLFLAQALSERFPETEPQIVHRVYRLDRALAERLFGEGVASVMPAAGLVDVHRYLTITLDGRRIAVDATFAGERWDGRSPMPLACGEGEDFPAGKTPDEDKRALENEHCDSKVRERFIGALTVRSRTGA
jgi:orotate phosphoribosyltransferase